MTVKLLESTQRLNNIFSKSLDVTKDVIFISVGVF